MPAVSIGAIVRSVSYAVVAAAIVAATFHFRQHDPKPRNSAGIAAAPSTNPLERELARCEALGMAAKDDAACAAAWAENRRQFFTDIPSLSAPSASAKPGQPP
jgi:conjugative transfer region protein TrbK